MISIRWARLQERDEIQGYLFENMGKIPHDRWRNILDCRWNRHDDRYGIVAHENGKLAGFLGIVFADRVIAGKPRRLGNITSWFLERHLRRSGLGQQMLALITEDNNVTYTALSANFRSGALLEKIGWQLLDNTRLFWYYTPAPAASGTRLISGVENLEDQLAPGHRQMIADHQGLNLTPHLFCDGDGNRLFFFTYVKIKGDEGRAHHEILYADDRVMLAKIAPQLASALLGSEKSVLSCDKRFLAFDETSDDAQALSVSRYFKPADNMSAWEVDFLYSEVVLLDLKIY